MTVMGEMDADGTRCNNSPIKVKVGEYHSKTLRAETSVNTKKASIQLVKMSFLQTCFLDYPNAQRYPNTNSLHLT